MDEKKNISEGFSEVTEAIQKNTFFSKCKNFNILTWLGITLTILFIIFALINATNFRWWIMLPIFIIAFVILFKQKNRSTGLEKGFVITTFWILIIAFFFRDAFLSEKLTTIYYNLADKVDELKSFF
jgi:membrane-associated HD superfamily phosphohydrolase